MNTEEFGNACMDFAEARDLGVIVSALRSCGRAVVVSHARPDGDAYGCSLGLCLSMRESGRNAVFVVSGEVPAMYRYLEPAGVMVSPEMFVRKPGDVVFVLDCGELSRLQKEVAAAVGGCLCTALTITRAPEDSGKAPTSTRTRAPRRSWLCV